MPRAALLLPLVLAAVVSAVPPDAATQKAAAPPDAEAARGRAVAPDGHKVELWAHEPLLANPVSFAFDEHGKCYVAETYRHTDGVTDTRGHMYWLDDDINCRSVADRVAMFKKHKYPAYEKFGERLVTVWDSTGKGVADKSEVFAGPYNRPEDGLAAGVLARNGSVYLACIPDLYKFDAATKKQESLSTGYGIHVQFIGHDLHGLIMGPDGKLYFSIGDRGFNVTTKEGKHLNYPDTGAVLRCEPDGKNLEVVHTGLRNPQELAFDNYGNLFTYDNNSDSGDQARWVLITEGGDSGWRCGYQHGTLYHTPAVPQGNRGPWNTEKLWHTQTPDQPAYVLPPLKHFGNGPSGLAHYPGVGLNDKYKDHFFATDFTANPGGSKIWSLAVKPKGAAFEVVDLKPFVQNMVPTDVDFGPDGAMYWLDWTGGWNKPAKGRIFRVTDTEAMAKPVVKESQTLIAEGMKKREIPELVKLLGHPHQKVRLEAQYELVARGPVTDKPLAVAASAGEKLSRLHAIWALGAVGTQTASLAIQTFTSDPDPEIQIQALRTYGRFTAPSRTRAISALGSPDARVKAEAAVLLGKAIKARTEPTAPPLARIPVRPVTELADVGPLFQLLKDNADADPYLRHAAVMGLVNSTDNPNEILDAFTAYKEKSRIIIPFDSEKDKFDHPSVRLGVVLAMRKLKGPRVAEFLNDVDPKVVAEAARAVYDENLTDGLLPLAKLTEKAAQPEPVAFRALAANFKLGDAASADRLAKFAANPSEADVLRGVALKLLADWPAPGRRDPITGLAMSLPAREREPAVAAFRGVLKAVFTSSTAVRSEAVQTAKKLNVTDVAPFLVSLVGDDKAPAITRVDALFALEGLNAKELAEATGLAAGSTDAKVRAAGRVVKAKANRKTAAEDLAKVASAADATAAEQQLAFTALGNLPEDKTADAALAGWLDKLLDGKVAAEIQLDLLEASQSRATAKYKLFAPLREKLKAVDDAVRKKAGPNMALRFPDAMHGGDADRGRSIFLNNNAVYCQRCHKVDNQGGEVGPVLNGLGAKKDRAYLMESLVNPNAQIAEGYKSVILELTSGKQVSGVLREKTAKQYTLVTAENKQIIVPADEVESEKPDKSAMPDDLYKKLSKREMRDLIEFLATLK